MTAAELARNAVRDRLDAGMDYCFICEQDEAMGVSEDDIDDAMDEANDLILELRNRLGIL